MTDTASKAANEAPTGTQEDPLAMFFDDSFNPTSYVDALFQSITGSENKYSKQLLVRLSSTLLNVITHLDYQTNDISRDLAAKFEALKTLSLNLTHGSEVDAEGSNENTRLQYYISALQNVVDKLQQETLEANQQLNKEIGGQQPVAVESLVLLNRVKLNIKHVLKILQSVRDMLGHDPSQITIDQFQHLLNLLHDSLKVQLRSKSEKEAKIASNTVKQLKELSHIFSHFTTFGPSYARFITKLDSEL